MGDSRRPSRLIHPWDRRFHLFSALSDRRLHDYLRSLRGGVLVGTRASLNLLMAQLVHPSVFCIAQEHMFLDYYAPPMRAAITRLYPRVDMVLTLTDEDADAYRTALGQATPVRTIPNAARQIGRHRTDLSQRVVVAAGRLLPVKGFGLLIDAFAQVAGEHPDWMLRIYGTGPLHDELQGRIDAIGAGHNIALMGYDDELPARLAEGSLFVLSSTHEGLPLVLLEAMGSGLPCVAFESQGGAASVMVNGVTGLLVPAGNVDALAAAIRRLIDDPATLGRMSAAASERAQVYSPDRVGSLWDTLLEDIIDAPRGDARRRRLTVDWSDVPPPRQNKGDRRGE